MVHVSSEISKDVYDTFSVTHSPTTPNTNNVSHSPELARVHCPVNKWIVCFLSKKKTQTLQQNNMNDRNTPARMISKNVILSSVQTEDTH